jgi:hypothetical protein
MKGESILKVITFIPLCIYTKLFANILTAESKVTTLNTEDKLNLSGGKQRS